MEQQTTEKFEQWCIVEIMGHNVFAGFVSERTLGGTAMIQVDVPQVDEEHPAFTKLFSANAIYAISPTTEEHARQAAARIRQRPVTLYIIPEPKRLSAHVSDEGYPDDNDLNDDDDGDEPSKDIPF